jgi:hypothetical protein
VAAQPKKATTKAAAKRTGARHTTGQRSGQPRGKPPGLATALHRVITTPAGELTVHHVLVNHLRLGADVAVAAARAKVTRQTVHEWIAEGMRIATAIDAGKVTEADLSAKDRAVHQFAWDAVEAVAEAEAQALGNVVRLGAGNATRRRVTRTYEGAGADATEVGRVETEELLAPVLAANTFLLERRFSERWTRRQQIEVVTGAESIDTPPESPLPALMAALEAMERRRTDTAALLEKGEKGETDGG